MKKGLPLHQVKLIISPFECFMDNIRPHIIYPNSTLKYYKALMRQCYEDLAWIHKHIEMHKQ